MVQQVAVRLQQFFHRLCHQGFALGRYSQVLGSAIRDAAFTHHEVSKHQPVDPDRDSGCFYSQCLRQLVAEQIADSTFIQVGTGRQFIQMRFGSATTFYKGNPQYFSKYS